MTEIKRRLHMPPPERLRKMFSMSLRDALITLALFLCALFVSDMVFRITGQSADVTLFFLLAVMLISRYTEGFLSGLIASVASLFAINLFFTYPFLALDFSLADYPVTFMGLLVASVITCASTAQIKEQMQNLQARERQAKELNEQNMRMAREREEIRMRAEREKMRGNLLRGISHDLRTPLTAIVGATSVLQENASLSEAERQRLLSDIQNDAQWLIRMVENLLSVTRIGGGGGANIQKTDEIVEEIVAEAVSKVRQKHEGLQLKVRVPDEMLIVPMDGMLIEQVLINLMDNALRHSGAPDTVTLRVWKENGRAVFEVRDKGKGIDEAEMPYLFEGLSAPSSVKSADATRGMGIGLSVCMSIVKAHGGELTARNEPDGGASFRFTLAAKEGDFDVGETDDYGG